MALDYVHSHVQTITLYYVHVHSALMIIIYQMRITERAILLIERSNLSALTRAGETDYNRWVSIKRGRARVGAEEIEILGKVYPEYRWWLSTGDVMPEIGQTSPAYDEAHRNLSSPSAG